MFWGHIVPDILRVINERYRVGAAFSSLSPLSQLISSVSWLPKCRISSQARWEQKVLVAFIFISICFIYLLLQGLESQKPKLALNSLRWPRITLNSWSSCPAGQMLELQACASVIRCIYLCSGSFVKIYIETIIVHMYKFLSYIVI